jgi:hypothetical protein
MQLEDIKGIGPSTAGDLRSIGVENPADLFSVTDAELAEINITPLKADEWRAQVAARRQGLEEEMTLSHPEPEEAEVPGGLATTAEPYPGPELEPVEDMVDLTFIKMHGRPDVGEVMIHNRRYRQGLPARVPRADAEAIAARPQYEFQIRSVYGYVQWN